jgi:hypothetical protein
VSLDAQEQQENLAETDTEENQGELETGPVSLSPMEQPTMKQRKIAFVAFIAYAVFIIWAGIMVQNQANIVANEAQCSFQCNLMTSAVMPLFYLLGFGFPAKLLIERSRKT